MKGPHPSWSYTLGNYEMVCTLEERSDGSFLVLVTKNGQELERLTFPKPVPGDFESAMAASNAAMKLQEKYRLQAAQGMQPEFNRLRPR
jgi:hypothetical protein